MTMSIITFLDAISISIVCMNKKFKIIRIIKIIRITRDCSKKS